MVVIKRDNTEAIFNKTKIVVAITKAMKHGNGVKRKLAEDIADEIYEENKDNSEISIYDIEQEVFDKLISKKQRLTARAYERYRSIREFQRECENSTDKDIMDLYYRNNEELKGENSNKNPTLNPTVRDYQAGIVNKDITRRFLLPPDIVEAHDDGIIHFHDADYYAQSEHNCDLINMEDMLQNGTVISEVLIEKPHSFSTACNIATQIIAQVASNQYGGQSMTLTHLAPFVDISRQKIHKDVINELGELKISEDKINEIVESRVREEIKKGIQTIQYQIVTLQTSNGQTPFCSIFMYLNEAKNDREKEDLALIIEEALRQRYQGVKNEQGVWITPAFPKLLYVLEEDNITEDSKYWYLTKLAAKCSAKRLVPDYISEKKMKELKEGNCFPVMG